MAVSPNIIDGFYPKSNDLYFIIICFCIKYVSDSLIFLKVVEWKPFFRSWKRAITPKRIGWFYLKSNDIHFMIIYLCIKFESNTLIFLKDIERKPFFNYFSTLIKGSNSKNNWWILPKFKRPIFYNYMLVYKIWIQLLFSNVMERKPFLKVKKKP